MAAAKIAPESIAQNSRSCRNTELLAMHLPTKRDWEGKQLETNDRQKLRQLHVCLGTCTASHLPKD